MCHTNAMKKSFLLLVPLMALLVGCGELKLGFTSDSHDAGMAGSNNNSQVLVDKYTYYSGDEIDIEGKSVVHFTFDKSKTDSDLKKDDLVSIINVDNETFEYTIDDALNIGRKENIGLFIGADSTYVDGHLTISSSQAVKYVVIKARKYYYSSNSWNEDSVTIDSDVAIAINSSKYIKLTSEKDENGIPKVTECRYNTQEKNQIEIKVGPRRAFIEDIALYF